MDMQQLKDLCRGRWAEILSSVVGCDISLFDGSHHPCPKCGGTDRFRAFTDGSGGAICNQCLTRKNGDGFAVLQWLKNCDFITAAKAVAGELGVELANGKRKADPEEHLHWQIWNEPLATLWCMKKPPIQPESLVAFGARMARYRNNWQVLAIPIWGAGFTDPIGWVMYNLTGKTLPKYMGADKPPEYVKLKITSGSESGVIGPIEKLRRLGEFPRLLKLEGPTDAMAMHSAAPSDWICWTNSNGAKERPKPWIVDMAEGKQVYVLHDADIPGLDGATKVVGTDGRERPGWAPALASKAEACWLLRLPYPTQPDHGKDVRDWLNEEHTWTHFETLIDGAEPIQVGQEVVELLQQPVEAEDDPHRLARVNLHKYSIRNDGATLRFWRGEWYRWKRNRYRVLSKEELAFKLNASVKEEFDRLQLAAQTDAEGKKPAPARRVTSSLIRDVMQATQSICGLSNQVEMNSWIDGDTVERKNYLAFTNGILDVDALFRRDQDRLMLDHSEKWFSTTLFPYAFDPEAQCPRWNEFLDLVFEKDLERIRTLQEWFGYCVLPDTSQQKFLILEGLGGNGKSTVCAVLEAMLGEENCAGVSLESFSQRFQLTDTLGKLVNVMGDTGEVDKISEGALKQFVGGGRMWFDRKGINGITAYPTARIVMATNNRPRFTDRTMGIWRRIILLPMRIAIPLDSRILSMDKPWWWAQSGELPGVLIWALQGLARLRKQGHFTISPIERDEMEDYQNESNPARQFITDHCHANGADSVNCKELYERYTRWTKDNGYRHLASRPFSKEVERIFPAVKKMRVQQVGIRDYFWVGLSVNQEASGF